MKNAKRIIVSTAVVLFSIGLASSARASCSEDMRPKFRNNSSQHPSSGSQFASKPGVVVQGQNGKDDGKDVSIVGLWRVAFMVGGQVVDEGFDAWHSDGTEVLNDSVSPSTGNVCLGVYEQTAKRTFTLNHPSWTYDANGLVTGTAVIGEVVKVDRDGKTFIGTTTLDIYDLQENLLFHGDGEIKGKRITVD